MTRRRSGARGRLAVALTLLLPLGLASCTGHGRNDSVTVLASWTGKEETSFRQVLDAFTAKTGFEFHYQGTRAVQQVLLSDAQKGSPPDVAVLPSPGELGYYVSQGYLHPLDGVVDQQPSAYSEQWRQLERIGSEHLYTVVVKADLKSLIWFDPKAFDKPPPATWGELMQLGGEIEAAGRTPWCMGMGATPTSGFPGTDWVEDILLHQSGPSLYQEWANGKLRWTSPQVRQAWTTWGTVAADEKAVYGGAGGALLTDFGDAGRPMFTTSPGCYLDHEASFIMNNYQGCESASSPSTATAAPSTAATAPSTATAAPSTATTAPSTAATATATGDAAVPGTDFDFFPFPAIDPRYSQAREVSADLAGMFNDTPAARSLIQFLASDEAQRIWPAIHCGAFSADQNVGPKEYHEDVRQRIAQALTTASPLCFDASDLMPVAMRTAFQQAVLEYLNDPSQLDTILQELDQVQGDAYPPERPVFSCGE
jgi:alpha-glucoside transport system substrate-binding protein